MLPIELVPPTLRAGGAGAGAPATSAAAAAPAPAAVGGAGLMGSPHLPPRGTATLPAKQPPPRFIHDKVWMLSLGAVILLILLVCVTMYILHCRM